MNCTTCKQELVIDCFSMYCDCNKYVGEDNDFVYTYLNKNIVSQINARTFCDRLNVTRSLYSAREIAIRSSCKLVCKLYIKPNTRLTNLYNNQFICQYNDILSVEVIEDLGARDITY